MDPHIYRLAPELRRSAIIAIVGCALVTGVTCWVAYVLERELWAIVVCCSVLGAISLAMIVALRWAIYVDGSGVARRWLFGWDLWSWSDFASGRIRKRHAVTFVDPQRSCWSRRLDLACIADAERKELIQLINNHYRLPDAPTQPEMLQIKYGFRRSVQFRRQELRLTVRGETVCLAWNDVQRLRITRDDPVRRDFARLTLVLPGHEIELKWHHGSPTWTGASAEEVNEFLLAHVHRDRIDIDIEDERPVRKEDVQKELDLMRTNERQLRICMSVLALLAAAILIWAAIDEGLKVLPLAGMAGLSVPIYWFVVRESRKRAKRLETWLSEIQDERKPVSKTKW